MHGLARAAALHAAVALEAEGSAQFLTIQTRNSKKPKKRNPPPPRGAQHGRAEEGQDVARGGWDSVVV
eukprot:3204335-Alexandrium_andersonii.AAC.1